MSEKIGALEPGEVDAFKMSVTAFVECGPELSMRPNRDMRMSQLWLLVMVNIATLVPSESHCWTFAANVGFWLAKADTSGLTLPFVKPAKLTVWGAGAGRLEQPVRIEASNAAMVSDARVFMKRK